MKDQLISVDGGEMRTSSNKKKYIITFLLSFILIVCLVILQSNNTGYKNDIRILKNRAIEADESEDDKNCLKRDKKTNKCLNCVSNYYLVDEICKPYSFMATYFSDSKDKEIQLINEPYRFYIVEMYMNNTKIDTKTSYKFSSVGNHTIYFYMNISSIASLGAMFSKIERMTSISFTPDFNTKKC